jgi:hypothetical protein
MTLNRKQFMPESMAALQRLSEIPSYSEVSGFSPTHNTPLEEYEFHDAQMKKYHEETVKPWEEHTMALMTKEGIPQHPKLRPQYDRGLITGQDYARELLLSLSHS